MIFHRADLVPAYAFGENDLFKQVVFSEGSLGRRLQDLFKKIMGFAPCLFVGEYIGILPYRIPLTTVGECFIFLFINMVVVFLYSNALASFSGKSNLSAEAHQSHRGGGGPLS